MKEELQNVSQESIAQALAADYFCIYYVNVENNKFTEYSASKEYRALGLPKSGDDFIGFSRERFIAAAISPREFTNVPSISNTHNLYI